MAACVSCVVVAAAALGVLSVPVVLGALGASCVIAIISFRHSGPQAPAHVFTPVPDSEQPVLVAAPRVADLVTQPISSSDVA